MNHPKNILITGASGLVGTRLTELLIARGDKVCHLTRSQHPSKTPTFLWDVTKGTINEKAFLNIDTIVHLAGASVADKRWTDKRKKEILESRTKSTRLLFETLRKSKYDIKNFICASAIGYYGFEGDGEYTEESPAGKDFMASVTKQWEHEADKISQLGMRLVKLRIGIVLSEKGGALKEMAKPVRFFAGAPLGSGDQFVSWIHLDDLCGIFLKAIDDGTLHGAYNAVAPNPVTNREMTKAIAKVLHKPAFLPAVPGAVLKLILGDMADVVLNGSRISSDKIQKAGYSFRFTSLDKSLDDLLG